MVSDAVRAQPFPPVSDREGTPLSEDTATIAGLRVQLRIVTTRLTLLEREANRWEHDTRPAADFIHYLRRIGLLPSTIP